MTEANLRLSWPSYTS